MRKITIQFTRHVLLFFLLIAIFIPVLSMADHSHTDYKISYFIDAQNIQKIADISQADAELNFKRIFSNRLNFGFLNGPLWLKIDIPEKSTAQLMELNSPAITSVNLYSTHDDNVVSLQKNQIISTDIDFRALLLELPSGSTSFIKITAAGNLFLKYFMSEKHDYLSHSGNDYLSIGLFLGIVFSFAIFVLINQKILKHKDNIYYLIFVLSVGLYVSAYSGLLSQYIIEPKFNSLIIHLLTYVIILVALAFTRDFLSTAKQHQTVDIFIKTLFYTAFLNLLLFPFYDSVVVYKLGRYLEICVPAVILYASVNSYARGKKEARFLVIGWGFYFASFIFSSFMQIGVLPLSFLTEYSMHFGITAVIICLAWALLERTIDSMSHDEKITSENVHQSSDYIEHLKSEIALKEQSVLLHADLIAQKDKEIAYTQANIRQQAVLDQNTGLLNYISFIGQFQHYFDDAKRYQYPVITLLIALDNFEEMIADQGESCANQFLQKAANIISQESRNTDLVARYVNDEIIFVMTHSLIDHALIKAEDLLSKIKNINLPEHSGLATTASIGMTVMDESAKIGDSRLYLSEVENSLLQSKEEGGDCFNVYSYAEMSVKS